MSRPNISEIENAFQPASEVSDVDRFAGRASEVKDAYYGLLADGAHIAVVGNRGIGKTSLARQIINMAKGDNSLLERLDVEHHGKLDYATFYFACGTGTKSTEQLLESLLTSDRCLAEWIYEIPTASKIMRGYSPKFSAKPMGVGVELGGEKKTETSSEYAIQTHSVETVFSNVVAAIEAKGLAQNGLLIVIDEFDQIADPSGFASFLKALSTNVPKVKFCLVGVAHDIEQLMKEHRSADRLFAGSIITLPSMSNAELKQIISIAESLIGGFIRFTPEGAERAAALAQGHPYMVHLIGKYAFRFAFEEGRNEISAADVDQTLRQIAEKGRDPVLEGRYKKAVASSEQRETVLKAFARVHAESDIDEVWTSTAYKIAIDEGVENASQYVGQLVSDEYGGEIEKIRDRYYRFHDSLFAAYVHARPRLIKVGAYP